MPSYQFECDVCEIRFTITRKMAEAGDPYACPHCNGETRRIFFAAPAIWHTEGSHNGDYGKGNVTGTKNDAFRKAWKKAYKEEAPDPNVLARDVPRNGSEKF